MELDYQSIPKRHAWSFHKFLESREPNIPHIPLLGRAVAECACGAKASLTVYVDPHWVSVHGWLWACEDAWELAYQQLAGAMARHYREGACAK